MNSTFQKPVKKPGARGSTKTGHGHAYYPVSQDWGYITGSDDGGGIKFVEGLHFMREGAESTQLASEKAIVSKLNEKLETEWMKRSEGPGAK